jgi:hypothetical protein
MDKESSDRVVRLLVEEFPSNHGPESNELLGFAIKANTPLPQEGHEGRGKVSQDKLGFGIRRLVPNIDPELKPTWRVFLGLLLREVVRIEWVPPAYVVVPVQR